MQLVPRFEVVPDGLLAALRDRDATLLLRGKVEDSNRDAIVAMMRLPWKQVYVETADPLLVAAIEKADDGPLVRRRGFVHVVDTDPSRMELPIRSLPVFLLSGRNDRGSAFEHALRRMTMLEELRRSGARQLVIVGESADPAPTELADLWATGFRTSIVVADVDDDAPERIAAWLDVNGSGPTASVVSMPDRDFAVAVVAAYGTAFSDDALLVRQRDEAGSIRHVDLIDVDDPERPLLDRYDLILDRDLAPIDDLSEEAFNAFFRGEGDWRAFAAGLPWTRDDGAWPLLQSQLRRIDAVGPAENRVTYIMSEPGAGGTTLARQLAFEAARDGYPTLVAGPVPFTPESLPMINFLTRAHQRQEDARAGSVETASEQLKEAESRLYETPWLLVFDRVHWELRDADLRRFVQELERSGRSVCVLVVTGTKREEAYFDTSRFKPIAVLHHMLEREQTLELGRHLNRFLRAYGKERADWQWRNFQESHAVRHMEGLATFWITLGFWLQTQYDLNDNIQDWIYRAFLKNAEGAELRRAVLQIAAFSSEGIPMPESLIEQGASPWPVPFLLDDRRAELAPLGLVRLPRAGRKFWALAHDILGRLLINALFYDFETRKALGYQEASDANHLRFMILREVSRSPSLGETVEREVGQEFATTIFKVDLDHGRGGWAHLWRDVLAALDEMPVALRKGSRVFLHHTAISRRRISYLDEAAFGVTGADKVELLTRAASDLEYALHSIEAGGGDEPDVNLYNSLANAYFDLAKVKAALGAPADELSELRRLASDATRHAYDQSPSSPYVIETHVKSLIASAEEAGAEGATYCIEALEIVYSAIRHDRNQLRRHALAGLADRAFAVLLAADTRERQRAEPDSWPEVLVAAWLALAAPFGGRAPESLNDVPPEVLAEVLHELERPAGDGNAQVARLRYQVLVAAAPQDFERQLEALDLLVATDYRLPPQLKLEYALLLFQRMRTEEADKQFKALRTLWRETDIFAQVPDHLRWLLTPEGDKRRVVNAVAAYDHGHRAMARVREFAQFDVPYRPQEFGVREHRSGTVFAAHVSFGHNGAFLRPVQAPRR
ncbi:hypothetical protein V5F63_10945 [Xanthobacter autotrophicus DSM 597]|uniref:hypothetical protein n=1 Tax=Xanthobacter wiegelii TaxID=3119913 RepID=UPI0037284891